MKFNLPFYLLAPDSTGGGDNRPTKAAPDPKIPELVDTTAALEGAGFESDSGSDDAPTPKKVSTPPPVPGGNGIQSLDDALGAARTVAEDAEEVRLDAASKAREDARTKAAQAAVPDPKRPEDDAVTPPAKVSADDATPPKPAPDAFDNFKLSPQAKASTSQAFDALKTEARRVVSERDSEVTKLKARVAELEPLAQPGKLAPEVEKELGELRAFRDRLAPEGDPVFTTKYEAPILATDEKITAALKAAGASDASIEAAKKIGYDKLHWGPVFQHIPDAQRGIERLLNQRDDQVESRDKAAKSAGENRAAWSAERSSELTRSDSERGNKASDALNKFVENHVAFKTDGLAPEHAKAFNDAVRPKVAQIAEMLRSGDPNSLGELAAAAALATAQGIQISGARALREADKKSISERDAKIVSLESALAARDKDIAALRKTTRPGMGGGSPSQVPRGSDNPAPAAGATNAGQSSGDALDARFGSSGDGR